MNAKEKKKILEYSWFLQTTKELIIAVLGGVIAIGLVGEPMPILMGVTFIIVILLTYFISWQQNKMLKEAGKK